MDHPGTGAPRESIERSTPYIREGRKTFRYRSTILCQVPEERGNLLFFPVFMRGKTTVGRNGVIFTKVAVVGEK
jgi:hypothetical protein